MQFDYMVCAENHIDSNGNARFNLHGEQPS